MWRTGPTYLGVRAGGGLAKSWSQRLRINGKPCNLGLGRYPIVTLAEARDKALENARAVAQGSEPRDRSRVPTFKQAATGTRSAWQREAQPERKREQRRKADLDRKRAQRAVVKAASNATLPAAPVMPAGLWWTGSVASHRDAR